jgi:hypothetical protein
MWGLVGRTSYKLAARLDALDSADLGAKAKATRLRGFGQQLTEACIRLVSKVHSCTKFANSWIGQENKVLQGSGPTARVSLPCYSLNKRRCVDM